MGEVVKLAVENMPSDDLRAAIEAAQQDLAQASQAPQLRKDPLRFVLSGISATLGVLGRNTVRWEKATADVVAARNPMSKEERDALRAEIIEAVENGANRGMRAEAKRMIRTIDSRLAVQIGIATGGAFVLGVVVVLVWLLWWSRCIHLTDGNQVCGILLRG